MQCDHIWRNFATYAKYYKSLAIAEALFEIWQTFIDVIVQVSISANAKMIKQNLAIWSHCQQVF